MVHNTRKKRHLHRNKEDTSKNERRELLAYYVGLPRRMHIEARFDERPRVQSKRGVNETKINYRKRKLSARDRQQALRHRQTKQRSPGGYKFAPLMPNRDFIQKSV